MQSRLSAAKRRTQLVEAALELADRSGLSAVTIRAVAEEAGVSLGVVHYCFEDKDALVAGMLRSILNDQIEMGQTALDRISPGCFGRGIDDAVNFMRELTVNWWSLVKEAPNRQLLAYEVIGFSLRQAESSPSWGMSARHEELALGVAIRWLDAVATQCGITWTDPNATAHAVLSLVDGVAWGWLTNHSDEVALQTLSSVMSLLVRGACTRTDADQEVPGEQFATV